MSDPDARRVEPAGIDLAKLLETVEDVILGGPREYTRAEVSSRAGMDRDEARRLWRALGFATVGDDETVFTDADVEALGEINKLASFGFTDPELRVAVARLFGQTFSRLASYQVQLLLEQVAQRPDVLTSQEQFAELVENVVPLLEHLQGYTWRRQLAANIARLAAQGTQQITAGPTELAVGFADLSRFTALTRKVSESELRELLDGFETIATDVVAQHEGRIVKNIGDEVLFVADEPATAAAIALDLVDAANADSRVPDLRAGLAYGAVISRLGDVFGSTVNIASRLTSLSRPGWILVDREMHAALADDDRFRLRPRRPESVRGFHRLHSWRLERNARR